MSGEEMAPDGALGRVSRRSFLAGLGGSVAYVLVRSGGRWIPHAFPAAAFPSGPVVRTVSVLRRADMLNATFHFYDVAFFQDAELRETYQATGGSAGNATVVVELPPQAVGEEVLFSKPKTGQTVRALLANNSRIGFIVPFNPDGHPFTADALLDWADRRLRLTPTTGPSLIETAIEAPWGITIAPVALGGLAGSTRFVSLPPVTREGVTGLWHARLARTDLFNGEPDLHLQPPPVRVVDAKTTADPIDDMPITPTQRKNIRNATQSEAPVKVDLLLLSTLGASLELQGDWTGDAPDTGGLTHWKHRSAIGRDNFVRIIEKGFLFPFGHRAVEITITERKIHTDNRAYLFKRSFIVVKQPIVDYATAPAKERFGGRAWPFRTVELTTLTTPDLLKGAKRERQRYSNASTKDDTNEAPFWIQGTDGKDIVFNVRATDREGQQVEFSLPLMFAQVTNGTRDGVQHTYHPTSWAGIILRYNAMSTNKALTAKQRARPVVELGGRKIALAPSTQPGETSYETAKFVLKATNVIDLGGGVPGSVAPILQANDQGAFRPELGPTDIRIDQIETLSGGAAKPAQITLNGTYLVDGYGTTNPAGVFADLVAPVGITFSADTSGGVATPNIQIAGLARDLGPIGDVASFLGATPKFDPKAYFPEVPSADVLVPKLLGGIGLADIIRPGDPSQAPQLTNRTIYPGGDTSKLPEAIETRMDWRPTLQNFGPFVVPLEGSSLTVEGLFVTKLDGSRAPTHDVRGELNGFSIEVGPIAIDFSHLHFTSRSGKKADVDMDVSDVRFTGTFSFVNEFAELMQSAGIGGLAIDADASGVQATYTLGIPDMAVGVFALKNLSLVAGVQVPFKGDEEASIRFDFGAVDDPFLLTISGLGGSGYFGITLSPRGIRAMRASLGFAASVAFSIPPVVSGSVTLTAGVLFILETIGEEQRVRLGGFLDLSGTVEVMGTISVSISLNLTFEYIPDDNKITATGVLTIEVDLALFSETITKTVTYSFGQGADPTVAQTWTEADWHGYVGAFASDT